MYNLTRSITNKKWKSKIKWERDVSKKRQNLDETRQRRLRICLCVCALVCEWKKCEKWGKRWSVWNFSFAICDVKQNHFSSLLRLSLVFVFRSRILLRFSGLFFFFFVSNECKYQLRSFEKWKEKIASLILAFVLRFFTCNVLINGHFSSFQIYLLFRFFFSRFSPILFHVESFVYFSWRFWQPTKSTFVSTSSHKMCWHAIMFQPEKKRDFLFLNKFLFAQNRKELKEFYEFCTFGLELPLSLCRCDVQNWSSYLARWWFLFLCWIIVHFLVPIVLRSRPHCTDIWLEKKINENWSGTRAQRTKENWTK